MKTLFSSNAPAKLFLLAGLLLGTMAQAQSLNCSSALFPTNIGGGTHLSVPLSHLTGQESAAIARDIASHSTQSNIGTSGCTSDVPSCFGSSGLTFYEFEKLQDGFGRVLGGKGLRQTLVQNNLRSTFGWNYEISETYLCAASIGHKTFCTHTCDLRSEDAPGS